MTLGARIAAARQDRGLTQDQLADMAGVTRSAVAQWETDRSAPAITSLPRVARALNVSADILLGEPEMPVATTSRLVIRNLSVLAYANGFTLWHYKAPGESPDEIMQRGYFNDAADMLAVGDMILLSTRDGGRVVCVANDDADVVLVGVSS